MVSGTAGDTGRGSKSSGLAVEQTVAVAMRRYRAVVARLRCPRRSWMVRTSVRLAVYRRLVQCFLSSWNNDAELERPVSMAHQYATKA